MNDRYIVTGYVAIDDILKGYRFRDNCRATGTAAEILTVGVRAAQYFQNHHERTLCVMTRLGYVVRVSVSRFNRRLHALRKWLNGIVSLVVAKYAQGEVFIMDSMPLSVCKRARAGRCKKVRGKALSGFCAAKREKFCGWRLHQICTPEGVPVSFDLRPAAEQDLTPIHELTFALPPGSSVFGDKGDVSDPDAETILTATGVCFVADRRRNMSPNSWADDFDLRHYPKRIETVFSPLEAMRIQHLHARTNQGFDLKASASLLAPAFTNFISV
ncbi:MAG: IS982 family transposase [Chloroflexota bacterium]